MFRVPGLGFRVSLGFRDETALALVGRAVALGYLGVECVAVGLRGVCLNCPIHLTVLQEVTVGIGTKIAQL